jgi:Protein of unknown function (DUF3307)
MTLTEWILITLALMFIKHWYVDFVIQTDDEVKYKGVYGHPIGVQHSFKHGLGSILVFALAGLEPAWILLLSGVDAVVHYHIDWTKMNYGNRDISTPQFWSHLGLDQLAHYICYLILIYYAAIT